VAVVQISKIQIRRGLKNSSGGVPQLSSAELAWAVDTQELYIGNGSVAEGAPYVGNTKVLTEHDNLLQLASSYTFSSDDPSITSSVSRSLQSKVDEYVSVADYGAVGDGATDCVDAFTSAFTELFRNADTTYRKVLLVPNGTYLFESDLEIPSNTILKGETKNGVTLNFLDNNIRLITQIGSGLSDFSSTNRPQNIHIENITISRTTGQTVLTGATNSSFKDVIIKGDYSLGDEVTNIVTEPAAVMWENRIAGIRVSNVSFDGCTFQNNSVSVKCNQTITDSTIVNFDNCTFNINDTGIYINGIANQGTNWNINNSVFEEIAKQAFRSTTGHGTKIDSCRFDNCGNNTNTAAFPVSSIVHFGETTNNIVKDCSSNRQQEAGIVSSPTIASVTEVYNGEFVNFTDRIHSGIYLSDSFRPVSVFSSENKYFTINYFLRLSTHTRSGTLTITVDAESSNVSISDSYQYSSPNIASSGGILMTGFEFSATLEDNDTDSGIETVVLYYKNPLATGSTGTLSFDVTYGV